MHLSRGENIIARRLSRIFPVKMFKKKKRNHSNLRVFVEFASWSILKKKEKKCLFTTR